MTIDISTQEEKERAVNVQLSPYAVDKAGEIVSLVYLDKSIIVTINYSQNALHAFTERIVLQSPLGQDRSPWCVSPSLCYKIETS
jgi:hypothetical protein